MVLPRIKKKIIIPGLVILLIALVFFSAYFSSFIGDSLQLKEQISLSEKEKPSRAADQPEMAALQDYYMTLDPELERVPTERLYKAYLQTKALKHESRRSNSAPGLDWVEVGSDMGGRTRAILWDPNDAAGTKVWAASISGGLWYNTNIYDDESEWQCVNDLWPSLSVNSIVADPNNPMIYYAGTGEHQTARVIYRESSSVGIGIWKSMDGGETWEVIPATEDFKYISDLKVRNEDGLSVLYAGVVSGFYAGINHHSEPSDGLYRSVDGGDSWEQVLPDIIGKNSPYLPADLEIGPEGRIFVGTLKNMDGDGGATILYSDEGTAGTWTIYDDYEEIIRWDWQYDIPGRVVLACAPSNQNKVYAIIGAGYLNSAGFNYSRGRYILRSENGGQSWSERNLPGGNADWAKIAWHAMAISVNPTNSSQVFVGGKDTWKSTNGGYSWTRLSEWTRMYTGGGDDYVHCDQHMHLINDNNPNELLISTDGGMFFTENSNSNTPLFQEKNNNYSTLQFYTCDIYPIANINYFVGGLQDNGTLLSLDAPLVVGDMIDTGDGAYCFFDDNEPELLITSSYYNRFTLFQNWEHTDDMGLDGSGVFINPSDYDSDNNTVYANAVKFDGDNANQILRISGIPDNIQNELIDVPTDIDTYFSQVRVTPFGQGESTTLLLGSQNGRLFRIDNAQGNPSASEIGSDDFPTAYLSSIAFGQSEDTLLVSFSNYGVASVWQTYDGGNNWTDISGNLPDMPVRWALYHPENLTQIMLATEIGIWMTLDASREEVLWDPDPGMLNIRIDMLQMRPGDNKVLAATHGRGLMHTTWNEVIFTSVDENPAEHCTIKLFPNPASDFIQIETGSDVPINIQIVSATGKIVYQKTIISNESIDVRNWSKGFYLVKTNTGDVGKLVVK